MKPQIVIWLIALIPAVAVLAAQERGASAPQIVARHTFVMTQPPQHVPVTNIVDGPILGNGDLGIVTSGPPEEQRFYFGKNDFWSQDVSPLSVGGLVLRMPALAGASYRQEQDLANAEVRGAFTQETLTVKTRTWTAATENLAVIELSAEGGAGASATATLFPARAALIDSDKPVNLGREQHGDGRWFFEGLIDEVHVFDRALSEKGIRALANLGETPQGLVRRWGFDAGEGSSPVDGATQVVYAPTCPCPPETPRPYQDPQYEAGCRPLDSNYEHSGMGIRGRAIRTVSAWSHIDAGPAPPLEKVTVAAWIYIFRAGDANFILSKGDWNEAYSLSLDHGRLRFNVGNQFVRSARALPDHKWVHVAGSFDGSFLRAYVDGVEVVPGPRYAYGGASDDVLWITRNADGPRDEQFPWPNPIGPTSAPGIKGRELTFATRLVGTEGSASWDSLRFELIPGKKVYLVTSVLSDLDAPDHSSTAKARTATMTPAQITALNAAHRGWWKQFWSESYVAIGDPLLEQSYYASHYIMASASRTGKVAPGLYGPWITTDLAKWNGDYTLNYNHQTPYLALYASNHIATTDSYDPPVLSFMNRAKQYARTLLNVRGVYYPGHIGPWGMERAFRYDPFMGQQSNAAFLVQPMLMRYYSTYDLAYAHKVYPFILEVGNFWEDYLKFEGGRYQVHNDCPGEVGPWKGYPEWDKCAGSTTNPPNTLAYLRTTFKGLIDISTELGVDAGRRDKWQHILDHLSPVEGSSSWTVSMPAWPVGVIGLDSDPKLLEGIHARAGSMKERRNHPLYSPALARTGYTPNLLLDHLRSVVKEFAYPNGYLFYFGGGVENASTVPATINEMLMQSHEGVLRVFPVWPKDEDARFGNLRAYGAFLVSSELSEGTVSSLMIESEKGKECTLQNPWGARALRLYRNGRKAERLTGSRITFKTSAGEEIRVKPE